jgi:enediyne biosynthesis protein E4
MAKRTTKRKRKLRITIITVSISVLALVFIGIFISTTRKDYIPGEKIDGITSELTRYLPDGHPKNTFVDVTGEAGIDFRHFSGDRTAQLPEDMGSGVAWGDFDNDGWQDVFIANFSGPLDTPKEELLKSASTSKLYRNNRNGTFEDVSQNAGLALAAYANACAWGDYNNDGKLDLFVSTYGKNFLFKNNGDGTFDDVSRQTGIDAYDNYWTGVSWADFDLDGHLDIYVCGYVDYQPLSSHGTTLQYNAEVPAGINPSSFKPIGNLLFHNNGNGTFSEIAEKAGVKNENGRSLAGAWCDFDEDGFPDLYVANDVSDNALFRNKGDGTFEDVSYNSFVADYRGAMGIATGDWDNDGDMDMFVTHWIAQENALYNNLLSQINTRDIAANNRLKFMDEADRYGVGQIALAYIGFGTFFFDFNNDTRLDIFIANGSTFQQRENPKKLNPMKDQLLWNRGGKDGFYDVSAISGNYFNQAFTGRGAAYADYDNDGDLDLLVVNHNGPAILLRNDGGDESMHWIQLKLERNDKNKFAIGARIRVVAGEVTQVRKVDSQASYFSQNSLIQHFGLGNSNMVDTLQIVWPGGKMQSHYKLNANQIITITEQ